MTDKRFKRYDFCCAVDITDAAPTPQTAAARVTPEGYLEVDAYLARSGLLTYSDGVESWQEYRSKDELRAASETGGNAPITDDHPEDMVTSASWSALARGHAVGPPTIETLDDGNDYIRQRVAINDRALVQKILADDGPRELSIGFTSRIRTCPEGTSEDGTRCDAVQLGIHLNHNAVLQRGRSGQLARLALDGAAHSNMSNPKKPKNERADEAGAPTESATVVGPDGVEAEVPTWVAAELAEAAALRQAAAAPAPPAPAPAPAPAPPAPAPPAPAAPPESEDGGPPAAPPEDEETRDAAIRRRARLERYATQAGIGDPEIEATKDTDDLARLYVLARMPHAQIENLRGDALDAFVATAHATPAAKRAANTHPWEAPAPAKKDTAGDAENERTAAFMARNGY